MRYGTVIIFLINFEEVWGYRDPLGITDDSI